MNLNIMNLIIIFCEDLVKKGIESLDLIRKDEPYVA
jgi:hypothetical protein